MAIQLSTAVRNARLDQIEIITGATAKLYIRSGSPPADCAAGDQGTLLVTMTLPSNWMNDASSGQKTLNGSWTATAGADGTAGHFRIKDNGATTCHIQGTVAQGSGDLSLDNINISNGQTVTVTTFTLTDGNG